MIIIGSRALGLVAPHLLTRKPSDFDFVCTQDEFDIWLDTNKNRLGTYTQTQHKNKIAIEGNSNFEFEIIKDYSSSLLNDLVSKYNVGKTSFGLIPDVDMLFTLKSSHKYLKNSPHFWKTAVDYHTMKNAGAKVRPEYTEFLKLREKETYDYSHPSLMQDKKSFFGNDQNKYLYDHDSIHEAVKHLENPAYKYFAKDGTEVFSSKTKFFNCDRQIQLYAVMEESAVLALERSVTLFPNHYSLRDAWKLALSKVCSSITSGWFREFSYENIFKIVKMYPADYHEKFLAGVESGVIKKVDSLK